MDKLSEPFNKEIRIVKNNLLELNNRTMEMKITLEGINSRLYDTEKWISNQEDKTVEISPLENKKEKEI